MTTEKRPLPSHIAWRCGGLRDLLRALKAAPDAADRRIRDAGRKAILDAHARAHGCQRAEVAPGKRRWMTAEEYEAYRQETPGYRRDPERHRQAAMALPAKFRRERARAAGLAPREG
jgi:hypothetical protein